MTWNHKAPHDNNPKTKQVVILLSNLLLTRFMQDTDLFEKFKVIIMPRLIANVVNDFGPSHVAAIEKRCQDQYGLVAIFDDQQVYYRNPDVSVVSDGQNWERLDNFLPKPKIG